MCIRDRLQTRVYVGVECEAHQRFRWGTSWDARGLQRFASVVCALMGRAMGAHGWLVLVERLAW